MPDIVIEIGAVAGVAAFLGISVLTVLLLVQARDVRRLRDWAGRAPERDAELFEAASQSAAERAAGARAETPQPTAGQQAFSGLEETEVRSGAFRPYDTADYQQTGENASLTGELPHGDPFEAEARAVELRAKRQRVGNSSDRQEEVTLRERVGNSRPLQALVALVAIAAVAGVVYVGADQLAGEDDEGARQAQGQGQGQAQGQGQGQGGGNGGSQQTREAVDPSEVVVSVLNGTDASGLASSFQDGIADAGYQVGIVGNSQSTYTDSRVMFESGFRPEALELARSFDINQVEPMVQEVTEVVEGAPVAVVLGDDAIPAA